MRKLIIRFLKAILDTIENDPPTIALICPECESELPCGPIASGEFDEYRYCINCNLFIPLNKAITK